MTARGEQYARETHAETGPDEPTSQQAQDTGPATLDLLMAELHRLNEGIAGMRDTINLQQSAITRLEQGAKHDGSSAGPPASAGTSTSTTATATAAGTTTSTAGLIYVTVPAATVSSATATAMEHDGTSAPPSSPAGVQANTAASTAEHDGPSASARGRPSMQGGARQSSTLVRNTDEWASGELFSKPGESSSLLNNIVEEMSPEQQGSFVVGMPLGYSVNAAIKQNIWAGKYVDLATLLPNMSL